MAMEEDNKKLKEIGNNKEDLEKGILSYEDNEKQTIFKIFGIEMTAPKGLRNPRIIYISFIAVNFLALLLLRRLITQ